MMMMMQMQQQQQQFVFSDDATITNATIPEVYARSNGCNEYQGKETRQDDIKNGELEAW